MAQERERRGRDEGPGERGVEEETGDMGEPEGRAKEEPGKAASAAFSLSLSLCPSVSDPRWTTSANMWRWCGVIYLKLMVHLLHLFGPFLSKPL